MPPVTDGPLYHETGEKRQKRTGRREYIERYRQAGMTKGLDNRVSPTVAISDIQNFTLAMSLLDMVALGSSVMSWR